MQIIGGGGAASWILRLKPLLGPFPCARDIGWLRPASYELSFVTRRGRTSAHGEGCTVCFDRFGASG
jgi:hypothetical protein